MDTITFYRMTNCGHCDQTAAFLEDLGVPDTSVKIRMLDFGEDPETGKLQHNKEAWAEVKDFAGYYTAPVLVFPGRAIFPYPAPGTYGEKDSPEDEAGRWQEFSDAVRGHLCTTGISRVSCG